MNESPLDLFQAAIRGAFCEVGESVKPTRLPTWTSRQFGGDAMLISASRHTSGVRLEYDTAATWIELQLKFTRTSFSFIPFPPRPAVVALVVDDTEQIFTFDEGDIVHVDFGIRDGQIPAGTDTLALAHAVSVVVDGLAIRAHDGVPPDMLRRLVVAAMPMIPKTEEESTGPARGDCPQADGLSD